MTDAVDLLVLSLLWRFDRDFDSYFSGILEIENNLEGRAFNKVLVQVNEHYMQATWPKFYFCPHWDGYVFLLLHHHRPFVSHFAHM